MEIRRPLSQVDAATNTDNGYSNNLFVELLPQTFKPSTPLQKLYSPRKSKTKILLQEKFLKEFTSEFDNLRVVSSRINRKRGELIKDHIEGIKSNPTPKFTPKANPNRPLLQKKIQKKSYDSGKINKEKTKETPAPIIKSINFKQFNSVAKIVERISNSNTRVNSTPNDLHFVLSERNLSLDVNSALTPTHLFPKGGMRSMSLKPGQHSRRFSKEIIVKNIKTTETEHDHEERVTPNVYAGKVRMSKINIKNSYPKRQLSPNTENDPSKVLKERPKTGYRPTALVTEGNEKKLNDFFNNSPILQTEGNSSAKIQVYNRTGSTTNHLSKLTEKKTPRRLILKQPRPSNGSADKFFKNIPLEWQKNINSHTREIKSHRPETATSPAYSNPESNFFLLRGTSPERAHAAGSLELHSANNIRSAKFIDSKTKVSGCDYDLSLASAVNARMSRRFSQTPNVNDMNKFHRGGDKINPIRKARASIDMIDDSQKIKVSTILSNNKLANTNNDVDTNAEKAITNEDILLGFKDISLKQSELKNGMTSKREFQNFLSDTNEAHAEIEKLEIAMASRALQRQEFHSNKEAQKKRILNEFDIKAVIEEYVNKEKGEGFFNHDKVDSILKGLEFFLPLHKKMRVDLIRDAIYKFYPSGAIIFNQGDFGDLMYIILRGSVNVRIKKATPFGTIENVITAVIYDGGHFGEYSMMGTSTISQRKDKPVIQTNIIFTVLDSETGENNTTNINEYTHSKTHKPALNPEHDTHPIRVLKQFTPKTNTTPIAEVDENEEAKADSKFKERSRRTATIEVAESCDLLCIPRNKFQEIFLKIVQEELDVKLQILLCIPFFSEMDPYTLIPIANNLVQKVYKLGDTIIQEGDPVDKLMIISQGRCKSMFEMIRNVDAKPSTGLHGAKTNIKHFSVSSNDYSCNKTAFRSSEIQAAINKKNQQKSIVKINEARCLDNELLYADEENLIYRQQVPVNTYTRGDYFGGRCILQKADIDIFNDRLNKLAVLEVPSRITIIADSATVEIYELEKDNFRFVPYFLGRLLINGLKNIKEFDEVDLETIKRKTDDWIEFKKEKVTSILNKNKQDYARYKKF